MNDQITFVQDCCTCKTQQSYRCPNNPSGHVSIQTAKFRCCCNSHSLVFTPALRDIFFLHFPHRSSQETAEILTATNSAFCSEPEELEPHEWAGQTNVMQLQQLWQKRWCWGKDEAVRSAGTWKIMKATNLLSITGSYFNKPSRELGFIYNTAQCRLGDTDHSDSCSPGGISPAAQEPEMTPNLFMFAPILGATSVLNMQKPQYCFALNWNFAPLILIFLRVTTKFCLFLHEK